MPTRPALQPCLLGRSNRQGAGAQAGDQRARDDTSHASTLIHILGRAHQLCGHHPCACAQRSGGAKHRACTPQPETLDRSTHRQDAGKRPIRVAVISYTTNAPRPSCQAAAAKIVHEVGHASHVTPPPGPNANKPPLLPQPNTHHMPSSRICAGQPSNAAIDPSATRAAPWHANTCIGRWGVILDTTSPYHRFPSCTKYKSGGKRPEHPAPIGGVQRRGLANTQRRA